MQFVSFIALFLVPIVLLLYLAFWCIQLAWVMTRSEADLGYRHDKWIWIIVFIFFAPLAPFVVLVVRWEYATARRSPPLVKTAASQQGRRGELYRKKYERAHRRLQELQARLADSGADIDDDTDEDLDGADDDDHPPLSEAGGDEDRSG